MTSYVDEITRKFNQSLEEVNEARKQVLHKQEIYPFVMQLLNESDKGNKLYPFLMRLLEENKELVTRLVHCQEAYEQEEKQATKYSGYNTEKFIENLRLKEKIKELEKENEALKTKTARAAKRKSK